MTQMHESIKSIKTEEVIKCQNSFIILELDSISHIFLIFLKSRESHRTSSKKLRQNFSLTKEFFWKINQETNLKNKWDGQYKHFLV